jgi:transposase InsO family protein
VHRYALVGGLLHRRGQRGDVVREVARLAESELLLPYEQRRHLSRATIYRIRKKAREGGARALMRKTRADKGSVRAIEPEIVQQLVAMRTDYPWASVPMLIRILELQQKVPEGALCPSTVRRLLRRQAPSGRREEGQRAYRRWEPEGPMAMWQGDASPGPYLGERRLQLYAWMDAYSRAIVSAQYYENQRLPAFDDCLWQGIARHGVPTSVHIDNGSVYVSHHFLRVLADLGVLPIHATPYHPMGKGRLERWFFVCQTQFEPALRTMIESGEISTLEQVNELFARWLEEYNHRPHGTTKRPPYELLGDTRPYPDLRRLGEIFLWREERKVTKRGEISLGGNHYAVPDDLVGLRVTAAFHPFDLSEVYIELEGQTITAKPSQPVAHLAHPKLQTRPARRQPTAPAEYLRHLPKPPGEEPPPPPSYALTDRSLQDLLQATLGRELRPEEGDLVRVVLSRPGLPVPGEAKKRLQAFVRRAGRELHLSRYLAAITRDGEI